MEEKQFNTREVLLYLSTFYRGDWPKIYQAIKDKITLDPDAVKEAVNHNHEKYVTILDEDYPLSLKQLTQPPFLLFYRGNITLAKDCNNTLAYIGSREASDYGLNCAKLIAGDLAKQGYRIISGLARGIDASALTEAAKYHQAIAVIGNGFDTYYPPINSTLQRKIEKEGLLLSEYPLGVSPDAKNFPLRNRIIAALCQGIIVGEAHEHSGTSITVNYGLALGKSIFCLPYPIEAHSICNRLIQEGASLIESAEDVIEGLQ